MAHHTTTSNDSIVDQLAKMKIPLTIAETASMLGLHTMTVYKWTRKGKMPSIHLGGTVRIDPSSLARWLSDRQMG